MALLNLLISGPSQVIRAIGEPVNIKMAKSDRYQGFRGSYKFLEFILVNILKEAIISASVERVKVSV
jgi:hypothetical protein